MFLKILKRDLSRKKAMNLVLFVLIALASTLVASSTNLMYSTTTAVDRFIQNSQVADFTIKIANRPENKEQIEEWADQMPSIDRRYLEMQIDVPPSDITLSNTSKQISSTTTILLAPLPENVNLVFGQDDQAFTVQDGEIALPINIKNTTGIELGDQLTIDLEGISKTFLVKEFFKDALMGSDLIGLKRFILSDHDYEDFKQNVPEEKWIQFWRFVENPEADQVDLLTEFSKANILSDFDIDKSFVELMFMTDRILSALLFIVSLFLIFIAFLTLRFTIVSTIQDDYKEIGVMKAIGFTNRSIKKLYLMKYLGLSVLSGAIGLGVSIPLTNMMSVRISEYIILPDNRIGLIISIFSTVMIIAITLLFCSLCMRNISKASAIDAIRQGHNGERFKASWKMNLHKSKFLHPALFLAISDVGNQFKRYTTLMITFVLSTAIILIPLNLANTILAPKFISYFGATQADFYSLTEVVEAPMSTIHDEMALLEQEFQDKHFDVTLSVDYFFNTKYILDNGEPGRRIIGMNSETKADLGEYEYLDGVAPKLANEIAITGIMSEKFNKKIGDSIIFEIDGKEETFLISGTHQTINNEGYAVRLSDNFKPLNIAGYQFMGHINANPDEKPLIIEEMKAQLPHLNIKSAMDIMGDLTGGFMAQLKMIILLIIAVVSLITFFITSLFIRLLIAKEVQGIAIMKSLGFTNGQIKVWQSLRILILLMGSIIMGVFVANVLGERLVGIIFKMFGLTDFSMHIEALQVYLWCPLFIIIVVLLAVYTSCGQIKKIQVWDMNED